MGRIEELPHSVLPAATPCWVHHHPKAAAGTLWNDTQCFWISEIVKAEMFLLVWLHRLIQDNISTHRVVIGMEEEEDKLLLRFVARIKKRRERENLHSTASLGVDLHLSMVVAVKAAGISGA